MSAQPTELRACPLCRSEPIRNGRGQVGGVLCANGDHRVQVYRKTQDEADESWNARAPDPALLDKIERLEAAILGMIEAHDHGEPEDWFNRRQIALRELKEQP